MAMPQTEAKRRRLEALEQRQAASKSVQTPPLASKPTTAPRDFSSKSGDKRNSNRNKPARSTPGPAGAANIALGPSNVGTLRSLGGDALAGPSGASEEPLYRVVSERLQGRFAAEGEEVSAADRPDPLADTSPTAAIESLLRSLLKSANKSVDASSILESKVQGKSLLLHNPMGQAAANERRREREGREMGQRSKIRMGAKEQRETKVFEIQPQFQKYSLYDPLQALWKEYMTELLKGSSGSMLASRILTADFHGAVLTVVEAKDPIQVGIKGVVVRETQKTFHLITRLDTMRVVPKKGVVFAFPWGESDVRLFGTQLVDRDGSTTSKGASKTRPTILL